MAKKTYPDLSAAGELGDSDLGAVWQDGRLRKVAQSVLKAYFQEGFGGAVEALTVSGIDTSYGTIHVFNAIPTGGTSWQDVSGIGGSNVVSGIGFNARSDGTRDTSDAPSVALLKVYDGSLWFLFYDPATSWRPLCHLQNGTFDVFYTGEDGVKTTASLGIAATAFKNNTGSLTAVLPDGSPGVSAGPDGFSLGTDEIFNKNHNIQIGRFNGGAGATASTFWRGDGSWATPAGGGGGNAVLGAGILRQRTVTLTSEQLLNLHASPIEVIPAPGAGKATIVLKVIYRHILGSTAYTIGVENALYFADSGVQVASSDGSVFANNSDNLQISDGASGDLTANFDNRAIVFTNVGPEMTNGDGTGVVTVQYAILDLTTGQFDSNDGIAVDLVGGAVNTQAGATQLGYGYNFIDVNDVNYASFQLPAAVAGAVVNVTFTGIGSGYVAIFAKEGTSDSINGQGNGAQFDLSKAHTQGYVGTLATFVCKVDGAWRGNVALD